jgi:hypothetical protein
MKNGEKKPKKPKKTKKNNSRPQGEFKQPEMEEIPPAIQSDN